MTTQEQLNKILEMLIKATESGSNFILEQAPDLAKEIVAYEAFSSFLWFILLTTIGTMFIVVIKKVSKNLEEYDREMFNMTAFPFSIFIALVFFIIAAHSLQNATKALIAPRLIILDYAKNFVGGVK